MQKTGDVVFYVEGGKKWNALVLTSAMKADIHPGATAQEDTPETEHLTLVIVTPRLPGIPNVQPLAGNLFSRVIFGVRPVDKTGGTGWSPKMTYEKYIDELNEIRGTKPPVIETKHYADGSSATGPGPLPDHSPDEQAKLSAANATVIEHHEPLQDGPTTIDEEVAAKRAAAQVTIDDATVENLADQPATLADPTAPAVEHHE